MREKEIIEEREKQQKQKYAFIETGIYIYGDIIEFKEINLFDNTVKMLIPESFIEMPFALQQVKYPSAYRPQIIMTNMDLSVNMGLTMFADKADQKKVREIAESIQNIIKKMYPDYRFFKSEYKSNEKNPYSWFDFRSYAFDDAVYNIHFVKLIGSHILQGCFNCPYAKAEDWKRAMLQMLNSLEAKGEERI